MSQPERALAVQSSAITDRGLNERRPLNEDSFLVDNTRGIFAVADGVGGAEAGEVASQTAIEVLDEAFRYQQDGEDIEDLMELAIQRANASIHRMSREHPKFSMMATTIVALHLSRNAATIGHVGDSRLYRLTPDGQLHRETEDHSVVEEEVRAGRMTPDQAANHPSKNVISRALGADETVDVDMKTTAVEEGTSFLLCSDGITRHISDGELRELLAQQISLEDLCAELKRRCYERGAEDNLTAVVIRTGLPAILPESNRTRSSERPEFARARAEEPALHFFDSQDVTEDGLSGLAGAPLPAAPAQQQVSSVISTKPITIYDQGSPKSSILRALVGFFAVLLLVAIVGVAFYAGTRSKWSFSFGRSTAEPTPQITSQPVPEEPFVKFERARREVDRDPSAWLFGQMKESLTDQGIQNPLDSADPEFLYLYGRAALFSGNDGEADKAFAQAIAKADQTASPANLLVKREATIALAAVTLKSNRTRWRVQARFDEIVKKPASGNSP